MEQCKGEGQGTCRKCKTINWMCFLYKVKDFEGSYCRKCAEELEKQKAKDSNNDKM